MQMADPHDGMLSFQQGLSVGILKIDPVPGYPDLYSHFDVPRPGTARFTYVRLSTDRETVEAFLTCVMNGKAKGDRFIFCEPFPPAPGSSQPATVDRREGTRYSAAFRHRRRTPTGDGR